MRERLTFAFILLTVVLLLGAGLVRTYVLRDLVREQTATQLSQRAELIDTIVQDRVAAGDEVDEEFLSVLVGSDDRLEYADAGEEPIVVHGPEYDGTDDVDDDLAASAGDSSSMVTLSQSESVLSDILGKDLGSITALFLLIAVAAGVAGFVVASMLSAPFKKLAVAAAALGRGRFDLDLPDTRIPEARAISDALRSSALQLEDRVHRERDFAEHASHVLRTPLTGVSLELEDLTLRDDIPQDAKEAAVRSLASIATAVSVAGDLVDLTRRGSLVAGAELPLTDLATQLAQRWTDRLATRNRSVSAAVEGDLDLSYTPGPIEHVTDLLLADVVRRGTGSVRIVFHGDPDGHLRIHVECQGRATETVAELDRVTQVRAVVEALGGRTTGDHPVDGIDLLLPHR